MFYHTHNINILIIKKGTLTVASLPWTKALCFIIRHSVILNSRQKTEKHVGLPEWDLFIGKDHYAKVFRMFTGSNSP